MTIKRAAIGDSLISELSQLARLGESSILLGPYYGGKNHVLDQVRKILETPPKQLSPDARRILSPSERIGSVLSIQLFSEAPISRKEDVWECACEALRREGYEVPECTPDDTRLLAPILNFVGSQKQGVDTARAGWTVFISSIDGLSPDLGYTLLKQVQCDIAEKNLVVILSGESQLSELLEEAMLFPSMRTFMLQGYERKEFGRLLRRHAQQRGLQFHWDEVIEPLWQLTGGNASFLIRILWALPLDDSWKPNIGSKLKDVVDFVEKEVRRGLGSILAFRRITEIVKRDPECWNNLDTLVTQGVVPLEPDQDYPRTLEFAGIAVRDRQDLRCASPLVERLLKIYYDRWHLGDLHARQGEWAKALQIYQGQEGQRPWAAIDLTSIYENMFALVSRFHAQARVGLPALRFAFLEGCKYLFGFAEVMLFARLPSGGWRGIDFAGAPSENPVDADLQAILNERKSATSPSRINPNTARFWVHILRASQDREALCIADSLRAPWMTRSRRLLLTQLANQYERAYEYALLLSEKTRNDQSTDVAGFVLDFVTQCRPGPLDLKAMLGGAARILQRHDYRRVAFCLVNAQQGRVFGFQEATDPNLVSVVGMTNWGLDRHQNDIQPWVVHHREPMVIADGRKHPLVNQEVVRAAGLRAFAVIPLLAPDGEAVGTLHIERRDGAIPLTEEIQLMMGLGRLLAGLIVSPVDTPVTPPPSERLDPVEKREPPSFTSESGQFWSQAGKAYDLVSKAGNLQEATFYLLSAAKEFGHRWGRMYLVDRGQPDYLVPDLCYGNDEKVNESFRAGRVRLSRRQDEVSESWLSIQQREPLMFRFAPEVNEISSRVTSKQVQYWAVPNPAYREELNKIPGEFWLDFPLLAGEQVLGKLTLECNENFSRQKFELYRLLMKVYAQLLKSILEREGAVPKEEITDRLEPTFVATVAHNLAGSIARLRDFAPIQEASGEEWYKKDKDFLDAYRQRLDRMEYLCRRLLRVARQPQLEMVSFDLCAELRRELAARECSRFKLECSGKIFVTADRHQINTMLDELVNNSHDAATPERPLAVWISVEEAESLGRKSVRIVYKDNGPGIPIALKRKVFENYFSWRPREGGSRGTGIGLSFVKRVVESHRGTIVETGIPGKGVEFVIEIPKESFLVEGWDK